MGQVSTRQKLDRREVRKLQRYVSFSESEIHDWFHEFCQSTKRGRDELYLTEEEFSAVYNSVYPGQSSDFAKHVFRTFDLDENSRVEFNEFLIGMSVSGSSDVRKQVAWAFRVYDVQKTGYILRDEMTQIVKSVFRMIGPEQLRHNGVSKTAEALADELFTQLDKDGDQRLSWQEFYDGAMENPIVVKLLQCCPPDVEHEIMDVEVY